MVTPKSFSNPTICVFDSGIGGLNLLKSCVQKMPYCDFVYVADNYNVPYGNLSKEQIFRLVNEKFDLINGLGCTAALIACNTVTALCAQSLRQKYSFPIVGIQPALKQAAKKGGDIAVFATEATAESSSFKKLLFEYATPRTKVYPMKNLAQKIEENIFDLNESFAFSLLPDIKADSVVLGCTHYIYLENFIKKRYGCEVFDGISGTVDHLISLLENIDKKNYNKQYLTFLCGNVDKNSHIYNKIL